MYDDPDLPRKDRKKWLELRRTGVGSSDIPQIVGASSWGGPLSVYESKTKEVAARPRKKMDALDAEEGLYMEPFLADLYTEITGLDTIAVPTCVHPDEPWRMASPDRLVVDKRGKVIGGLELKRPTPWAPEWSDEAIPGYVQIQCTWQQDVTALHRWDVLARQSGKDPILQRVTWDPELAAMLVEEARTFWHENVQKGVAPPPQTAEERLELMRQKWPDVLDVTLDAPPEAEAIAEELLLVVKRLRRLDARKEELEAELCGFLMDAARMRGAGHRWTFSWTERKGRVSWRKAAQQLARQLVPYRKGQDLAQILERFANFHRGKPRRAMLFTPGKGA